jgi:VRR-NUC domain-containing protein
MLSSMSHSCRHVKVTCINQYETVRKYECSDCGGVMMCSCDEAFGRRHLPHQLAEGTRLETKERLVVTLGFQDSVCNKCRGLPLDAAPKAALHGHTSKIHRYYWREIRMNSLERFASWLTTIGVEHEPLLHLDARYKKDYERITHDVVEEITAEHVRFPKYVYAEKSTAAVLRDNAVEFRTFEATYVRPATKGGTVWVNGEVVAVEEFATRVLEAEGFKVLRVESSPLHVLFATLMASVICDRNDPRVRLVSFGSRVGQGREKGNMVSADLPADFGSPGYGSRRSTTIENRLSELGVVSSLVTTFEDCYATSWPLRQYLWAHEIDDAEIAAQLLEVLPRDRTIAILRYLANDYWKRYLGWPDLMAYNNRDYFLAEVKGSGDKLSEEQKSWIEANRRDLCLPFKLLKVHRRDEIVVPEHRD